MKPIFAAALLLIVPLATHGAVPSPSAPDVVQPPKVIERSNPVFPYELIKMGVREGEVRIAFSVDPSGHIDDALAVAYTHPDFAEVTLATLKHWRFEPARYQGAAIGVVAEMVVKFEVEGTVVVTLTATDSVAALMYSLTGDHNAYRPRSLKELDRIPTPIAAPSPSFPARLAKSGESGNVTISFFIDETGAVRLPSVDSEGDADLAAYAINALRNWKFEPPMCKGRPVLVRAAQRFNFGPVSPKPADHSSS